MEAGREEALLTASWLSSQQGPQSQWQVSMLGEARKMTALLNHLACLTLFEEQVRGHIGSPGPQ